MNSACFLSNYMGLFTGRTLSASFFNTIQPITPHTLKGTRKMSYPAPTATQHTPAATHTVISPCPVPDPLVLAVLTSCYVGGGDGEKQNTTVQESGHRLLALSDTSSPETAQTLASHLLVLEALFLSLAKDAAEATRPSEKVKLIKASLQAQESYGRTVTLIYKLNKQAGDWDTVDELYWRCPTIRQS